MNIEISNKKFKKYQGFKSTALAVAISGYTCYYLRLYLFENDLTIFLYIIQPLSAATARYSQLFAISKDRRLNFLAGYLKH